MKGSSQEGKAAWQRIMEFRHWRRGRPFFVSHRVLEAIASPDLVQRGDYGAMLALRHYNQPPAVDLFVVAVYRELDETDGTRRPNRDREVL